MRNMVFPLKLILLLCLCMLAFSFQALCLDILMGSWVSTISSKDGFRSILQFKDDGTTASKICVVIDFRYELKGNSLTLTPVSVEDGTETEKFVIQIDGNLLTMKPSKSSGTVILRRVNDGAPRTGITGKWSFSAPSGATGFYTFTSDNRALLEIPMPGETVSNYNVKDGKLVINRGTEVSVMKMEISSDLLILRSEDGKKEFKYKRQTQ